MARAVDMPQMAFDIDANLKLLLQPLRIVRIGKPNISSDQAIPCSGIWPVKVQLFDQIKPGR